MHIGKNARYREGVCYVGFATSTQLALVRLLCEVIGTLDQFDLGRLYITTEGMAKGMDAFRFNMRFRVWKDAVLLHSLPLTMA